MKTISLIPSTEQVVTGQTWIGGPTYELQKQHVPGYAGHVRGLKAESQYGKPFAKITAECMEERLARCTNSEERERLQTSYKIEFGEPNLRKPQLQTAAERILEDARRQEKAVNERNYRTFQSMPKTINDIPPIDRLPVVGYQGFRPVFRHPLKQVVPPEKPQPYVHPLNQMDEGMAKTMLETNDRFRQTYEQQKPPIVGYTGFMTGIKAENMYGESYKDISHQVLQRKQR
ncbi:unnamed protein product (macronuclear) [Paramecium tetraurelia]|uniref:Uncharacterized protein n=1 Tax=Paramecium tetraurelia TaxID=5888 RepID=A0CVM1_PARTE|nr:uncharacterized protein GSPATT00011006001 [Paramecium tetraurelia]CAK74838.1 unnamed protein product [Paramecium tetraurelia]|eukprot:XP_001442235.1 hypothetical protein (macronuclear) [Paramecium tetraurelia strain d4-2]